MATAKHEQIQTKSTNVCEIKSTNDDDPRKVKFTFYRIRDTAYRLKESIEDGIVGEVNQWE